MFRVAIKKGARSRLGFTVAVMLAFAFRTVPCFHCPMGMSLATVARSAACHEAPHSRTPRFPQLHAACAGCSNMAVSATAPATLSDNLKAAETVSLLAAAPTFAQVLDVASANLTALALSLGPPGSQDNSALNTIVLLI